MARLAQFQVTPDLLAARQSSFLPPSPPAHLDTLIDAAAHVEQQHQQQQRELYNAQERLALAERLVTILRRTHQRSSHAQTSTVIRQLSAVLSKPAA